MTKISFLIAVTGVALIGFGYAVNSVTGLIDEMNENKHRNIEQDVNKESLSEECEDSGPDFRSTSEEESFDDE